jgi:acyl-[acyl carrier protein]--UDP-N-acetylglucosamine O-acyltransferase
MSLIHPTAVVSQDASLGENLKIGPITIVHGKVRIGSNSIIESHSEIGYSVRDQSDRGTLEIGSLSHIRSHSVFYEVAGPRFLSH